MELFVVLENGQIEINWDSLLLVTSVEFVSKIENSIKSSKNFFVADVVKIGSRGVSVYLKHDVTSVVHVFSYFNFEDGSSEVEENVIYPMDLKVLNKIMDVL